MAELFMPATIYAAGAANDAPPMVMIAPSKYIQGPGVIDEVGTYLGIYGCKRAAILASSRGHRTQAARVADSLVSSGAASVLAVFDGECSLAEIDRHAEVLKSENVDTLIAVGGGKCVDAGKAVAYRLGVRYAIVPTLASNDAPCSALSALYTPDGVMNGVEFFPHSPSLVVVDTAVIADASARYLVSGMGDAMATWYEARVCMSNADARTVLGARPTMAACAMGELCAKTIYEEGERALQAVTAAEVNASLEKVVEANTLLSGVGFESGGLAGAHGYAQGYTNVPIVEANYLHGEMVAMGVIAQLMMEDDEVEANRVARFFARVGLPVSLSQMSLASRDSAALDAVVEGARGFAAFRNLPFKVTPEKIKAGLIRADELGQIVTRETGDDAYRALHA